MDPELEMAEYQQMEHIFKELIANWEGKTYISIIKTQGKKLDIRMWADNVPRELED